MNSRNLSVKPYLQGFSVGLFLLVLIGLPWVTQAQPFSIENLTLGPDGKPRLEFQSDTRHYYILYRGDKVTAIGLASDIALGRAIQGSLSDPIPANLKAGFFRVRKIPLGEPLDSDGDGIDDVFELNRPAFLDPLNPNDAARDFDSDGLSNLAEYRQGSDPSVRSTVLTRVDSSSPPHGATGISVTRETILTFSNPLAASTIIRPDRFYATFAGRRILSRTELSIDRRRVTLFYLEPLPGNARVRVTFDGNGILDFLGREIDADGNDQPGGITEIEFDTLSQTQFPGTIVCGRVFASELASPVGGQTNMSVNAPLAGVTITADGLEEHVRTVTDQFGNFRLTNAPAGSFFVHIDGRTVRNDPAGIRWPDLRYYPYVGKEWQSVPGAETNIGEVFLPLITAGTLQTVSSTNATVITFPTNVVTEHSELQGVSVTVPPNALFSDSGARGGRVGIAPVPPDRLPGALPEGLSFPLVITVQTDGPSNFGQPAPVCFPNLGNPATGEMPLPPGAKSALWSFNHDTGRWEVVGPMTVSADGRLLCSDPGVGILAPGWHGTAQGTPGGGGEDCPTCERPQDDPNTKCNESLQSCTPESCNENNGTNPILFHSGEKYESVVDLRIKGVGMDFVWARSYGSRTELKTTQGNSWDFSYNIFLLQSGSTLRLCNGAGRDDTYYPLAGRTNVWIRNGFFQELVLGGGAYSMTLSDGKVLEFLPFDSSAAAGKIARIIDRNGNQINFAYDSFGRLAVVKDTLDREVTLGYNADGSLASITDFAGRSLRYSYYGANEAGGSPGDLKSVTTPAVVGTPNGNDFPNGKTTIYTYSKGFADDRLNHNLLTITDGRGSNYLVNIYSTTTDPRQIGFDRAVRQVRGGHVNDLTYVTQAPSGDNQQAVLKVILNDRVGNVSEHFYDVGSRLVMLREYTGRSVPDQPTTETDNRPVNRLRQTDPTYFETRYEYNLDSKPTRILHANGNITEMVYEADLNPTTAPARSRGNLRIRRRLPGTHSLPSDQVALVENYEYDTAFGCAACGFNFVTKFTDARGIVTLSQHDERGNLTNRVHAIAPITEQWEYNARGQMIRHRLPDDGSGHRRVDAYTYHASGPQRGYLKSKIVDAGGFNLATEFEYNSVGMVTRTTDPRGHDHQYAVNALDQVVREVSPEVLDGSGVRYAKDYFYDANNNLVRVETQNRADMESGGSVVAANPTWTITYEYEVLNHLIRKSDEVEAGRFVVTEYFYDGNRNRTLTRYGEATAGRQPENVVQIIYDERDLPFREVRAPGSPDQSTTQFDYDLNRNRIRTWQGIESDPHLTQFSFDGFNRLVSSTDAMGNTTTHSYDANGNRTATTIQGELMDVGGSEANVRLSETRWTFDSMNREIQKDVAFFNATNQAPIGDGLATTRTIYSGTSQTLAVINDNNHGRTNRYDTANRLALLTDAKGNTIRYTYDADSNMEAMLESEKSDLDGHVEEFTTKFRYDNLNRLISTTDNIGNVNRSGYDSRNNKTITIDALTNKVLYAYDGLNRLTRTTRLMTQDGTGMTPVTGQIVTRQTWDDTSRLTSQIDDNNNATTYLYDGLNRKFATVYADFTGQTNVLDVHHNAVRFTDANGNIVTNRYDLLSRITNKLVSVGPTVAATTTFERFQYDGLSRLVSASNDVSLVTRTHDSLGHVTREVQALTHSVPAVVGSVYDGVGNLTRLNYPGGRIVTTTYDELERKKVISDTSGMIATYYFVGPQRVTRRDYGNGTRCDYFYDGISGVPNEPADFGVKQMTRTRHIRIEDSNVIDDRTYTWDREGNKTQNKDLRPGSFQWRRDYGYDSAYRLIHSMKDAPTGVVEKITYNLDGVGNRLSLVGGTNGGSYTMDGRVPEPADRQLNQYTTSPSEARLNDKNGNLSSINLGRPSQRYLAYDYRNRMVAYSNVAAAIVAMYAYDALGRRVEKRIVRPSPKSVRFLIDRWQEIEEYDGFGVVHATYAFGRFIDEAINMRRGNDLTYYHCDASYSPTAISDSGGSVTERYDHSDFGLPGILTPPGVAIPMSMAQNSLLFHGRRYDSESSLIYFRTRHLDSSVGRYITRDTIGVWADNASLGNALSHAANNPATYLDPLGQKVCGKQRGCVGYTLDEQGSSCSGWPEEMPNTICYATYASALARSCGPHQSKFIFLVTGNTRDGKPPKTRPDGSVPPDTIDKPQPWFWDETSYWDYCWQDRMGKWHCGWDQTSQRERHPYTIFCVTCSGG